jgi:hypothetical protein
VSVSHHFDKTGEMDRMTNMFVFGSCILSFYPKSIAAPYADLMFTCYFSIKEVCQQNVEYEKTFLFISFNLFNMGHGDADGHVLRLISRVQWNHS